MPQPVLTVFGATGAQGGGLARAIFADPDHRFALRTVTRQPDGESARALARAGAQVVVADFDDACSMRQALEGAYGAFFVTSFWEHRSPDKELAQAHAMAGAAAQAGIRHAIWSTFEDTREFFPADGTRMPVLQRKYNVPHFDAKGEANRLFAQNRVPTTYLYTSACWEHLIHPGLGPKRRADGSLAITFPTGDRKIPWVGAEDIGRCAFGVFARGEELAGASIGIAGEHLTGARMAHELGAALGQPVAYEAVTPEQYRATGAPAADEMANMFQFKRDFNGRYCALREVERARALNPHLQDFAMWLANNKSRISLQ